MKSTTNQIRRNLVNQIKHNVWKKVWNKASIQIEDIQIEDQMSYEVRYQLRDKAWFRLKHEIQGQVRNTLMEQMENMTR